jgi:DNA-binding transcriptional LysR family regulator
MGLLAMTGLQSILAFSMAAKHSSFAQAARELGVTASSVAKSIGRLEQQLSVRLFHRTTRKVNLTPDGQLLFERCSRIVSDLEGLQSVAEEARNEVSGVLRISVPLTYGRQVVLPILETLLTKHPRLQLDVRFSDRRADLIREGLDAVVRVGVLEDSQLVARKFDKQHLVVCASPLYLKRMGTPRHPNELLQHHCLMYRQGTSGLNRPWEFRVQGKALSLSPTPRIVLDDGEALAQAAKSDLGLIQLPHYMATEALAAKQLVEVLTRFKPPAMPIAVVYPTHRHLPTRVRVFVESLVRARKNGSAT